MATPFGNYGLLYPQQVALTSHDSVRGFTANSFHKFGRVNAVNYANQTTNVGASVFFTISDAIIVSIYGNSYYILDEDNLIFKENQ